MDRAPVFGTGNAGSIPAGGVECFTGRDPVVDMSIFFKESKFHSEINGELTLRRYWNGSWTLSVPEGEWYSSNYLEKMWRVVLKNKTDISCRRILRHEMSVKNVLVLGAGAGCAIEAVRHFWPHSQVDAVDYDPMMIEIGKKIYKNFGNPHITSSIPRQVGEQGEIEGVRFFISDAALFVKNCQKKYDLIIVDLFCGNKPSLLLKDKDFISDIHKILKKPGIVLINFATYLSGEDGDIPKIWNGAFSELKQIKFKSNTLLVAGGVVESPLGLHCPPRKSNIPEDYYNIFQDRVWTETLQKRNFVVTGGTRSFLCIQRLPLGFCVVNAMHTDKEPDVAGLRNFGCRHGIIFWTPWEKKMAGWPWIKSLIPLHQKGNGFSIVAPEYRSKWSKMARRNLKKFEASGVGIGSVAADAFIEGLKSSTLKPSLKEGFVSMIKDADKSSMEFWVACPHINSITDLSTPSQLRWDFAQGIMGGLAVINYGNISAHFVAYSSDKGRTLRVATGLIDHWFKYALGHNIKYLNFGHIRQKWEPFSWRGYSDFKRRFIDQEICLSNGRWRVF